jgi:hypothetical protein
MLISFRVISESQERFLILNKHFINSESVTAMYAFDDWPESLKQLSNVAYLAFCMTRFRSLNFA